MRWSNFGTIRWGYPTGDHSVERDTPFPHLPAELVEALDKLFPLRSPDINAPDRQIWVEVGQRKVVDFLIATHRRQQAVILETN